MVDRDLLERMRSRSGASLGQCMQALTAAGGNPRAALNALAVAGLRGGRDPYDDGAPVISYEMDRYAQRVIESGLPDLIRLVRNAADTVTGVVLHADLGIPVRFIMVYFGASALDGDPRIALDITTGSNAIPSELGADDPSLQAFRFRFGYQETRPDVGPFDESPSLSWKEGALPECLFRYEMIRAAEHIAVVLGERGLPVSDRCRGGYARHDDLFDDAAAELERVERRLHSHFTRRDAVEEFARLCYAMPDKQTWLLNLATSHSRRAEDPVVR